MRKKNNKKIYWTNREQKSSIKSLYLNKYYLENIPSTSTLSTLLGKYTAHQSTAYKLANTNRAGTEHVSLLAINIGHENLAISRARLDDMLIHTNQARASIDR